MLPMSRDPHAFLEGARAIANQSATAGAGGDGAEVDGPGIDRLADLADRGEGATLLVPFTAALADTETLTIGVQFQDSANGSDWADFGDAQSQVVDAPSGGGTVTGVLKFRLPNLHLARQHVRAQHTPTFSAGATDTVALSGVLVVAGAQELPPA